jgi:GT2 family glycosyltransferase
MNFPDKIGIVTVLYNSQKVLDEFFESLNSQSYKNFLLYVVDNKSTDDSLALGKRLAKTSLFETKFIVNNDNYGVAKGNNQGIESAINDGCDYILLSNNDVVLKPDSIEKLYTGLNKMNADMVVPKIYYYKTNLIWAAGGKFKKFSMLTRHFGTKENDVGQYNSSYKIDYAPTCFMLIKKNVFEIVGLFDEKYFVYSDDADFVYRANLMKQNLFYIYDSIIGHNESSSTVKNSDFYYYYLYRNRIYFDKKHNNIYLINYMLNIIYHYTVRNIKFISNRHQWKIILKALNDGINM